MSHINVLGIDPSFRNWGMAHGIIHLPSLNIEIKHLQLVGTESRAGKDVRKNSDDLRCARELRGGMMLGCMGKAIAIAEVPVGSQSSRASWSLGIALGVLGACPIPLIEVTPTEVKLATVGTKTASKGEMIEWATTRYPDLNWLTKKVKGKVTFTNANEHLADAIAAIHAGVKTEQFKLTAAMLYSAAEK